MHIPSWLSLTIEEISLLNFSNAFLLGTETTCIWELIHTKSELEGRPETVFQLCSR
jgi:T-lymphoma invasion and metastasis-inducing protein 2